MPYNALRICFDILIIFIILPVKAGATITIPRNPTIGLNRIIIEFTIMSIAEFFAILFKLLPLY